MSRGREKKLDAPLRQLLADIRTRHPRRKSACTALIAEIFATDDQAVREHCISIYWQLRCRKGRRRLEQLVMSLVPAVEASNDEWIGPPEQKLAGDLIFAFGFMGTPASHRFLARLLRQSTSHLIRADVLEAMAFEEET